uniref:U2 small nuclear ribonucleoprotein B n=1 Tax=Aceria tosichella TaxID=561515 RepID=A0A6G1SC90_9ACAR
MDTNQDQGAETTAAPPHSSSSLAMDTTTNPEDNPLAMATTSSSSITNDPPPTQMAPTIATNTTTTNQSISEVAPKHTIYINNLNDKIKIEPMKQALYAAFSQFGPIIDVVMRKSYRLRGQAFIIFRDIESAARALRTMQGFIFYDKPLRILYAKTESDTITRQRGTFVQRPAKPKLEIKKREKSMMNGGSFAGDRHQQNNRATMMQEVVDQEPNKILFLTNLPDETNEAMLTLLFNQFPGFKEVRLIPGRSDIAFVEFENEYFAGTAKEALNGFNLSPTHKMRITFAKK